MDPYARVDDAIQAVARARKVVMASASAQVRAAEERDHFRSVAMLWFREHRYALTSLASESSVDAVDRALRKVLDSTGKAAARTTYAVAFKEARQALLRLRESLPADVVTPFSQPTTDAAPGFAPLASDVRMQAILERRWAECVACIQCGAHLAAVVMMGGLLESLFVSRQNRLTDKSALVNATRAPKRKGKALPLTEWTLNDYLEVANEIGWIGMATKRVGAVLRDYRNLVHPQSEYAQQVILTDQDARVLWDITKRVARELLGSH